MMRSKRILSALSTILLVSSLATAESVDTDFEQTKYGQAGMKFLEIGLSPRAEGLGGAATGMELGAASLFYNPAGLVASGSGEVFVAQTRWIADITINALAVSYVTSWATIGVSAMGIDYGSVPGYQMDAGGTVTSTGDIDLGTNAFGVGIARKVTDRFQVGIAGRFVTEDLGVSEGGKEQIMSFDAGTLYRTGLAGSVLSMSIRNFGRQAEHQDEGYDLPLIFRIGIAMDVFDAFSPQDGQSLLLSFDALHPRDRAEEALVGLEYSVSDMLYLRAAGRVGRDYTGADLNPSTVFTLASAGVGLKGNVSDRTVAVDYSWSNQGELLGGANRLGVTFGF